jgi:hypothetical protein
MPFNLEAARDEALQQVGSNTRRRFKYYNKGEVHKKSCKHLEGCKDPEACKGCVGKLPAGTCRNCIHQICETKLDLLKSPLDDLLGLYAQVRINLQQSQPEEYEQLRNVRTTQPPTMMMSDFHPVHDGDDGDLSEQTPQILLLQPKSCESVEGLRAHAVSAQEWLVHNLSPELAWIDKVVSAQVKSESECVDEAHYVYNRDGGFRGIKDAVSMILEFETCKRLWTGVAQIEKRFKVLRIRNRFRHPNAYGWSDMLMLLQIDLPETEGGSKGTFFVAEVRLQLSDYAEAKRSQGGGYFQSLMSAASIVRSKAAKKEQQALQVLLTYSLTESESLHTLCENMARFMIGQCLVETLEDKLVTLLQACSYQKMLKWAHKYALVNPYIDNTQFQLFFREAIVAYNGETDVIVARATKELRLKQLAVEEEKAKADSKKKGGGKKKKKKKKKKKEVDDPEVAALKKIENEAEGNYAASAMQCISTLLVQEMDHTDALERATHAAGGTATKDSLAFD